MGNDFITIAAGHGHSLTLKSDGSLAAWGFDDYGQVSDTPTSNDFVAISAGDYHSVALKSDGSLIAWGRNAYGESDVPAGNNFVAITGGVYHNIALTPEPTTLLLLGLGAVMVRVGRKS